MLAEHYDGDPDRDTSDLAVLATGTATAAATATARVLAHTSDQADGPAHRRMPNWALTAEPGRRVWALEGTGDFPAGLVTLLTEARDEVVEIQNKKRSGGAKNDRIGQVRVRHAFLPTRAGSSRAPARRSVPRPRQLSTC